MMAGDRSWMSDAAQGLAGNGYVAFAVQYRLFDPITRKNPWPAQLDDAQRSVRWVRANAAKYRIDPDRIASYGHSSGAQLAAFLGMRDTRDDSDPALAGISSRVMTVVDLAGTMDVVKRKSDPNTASDWAAILGGTPSSPPDDAAWRDFAPITFLDDRSPPFLILQGGADSPQQINDSRGMEAALREGSIEVVYGEFPGVDHFSWDWAHSGSWTLAFLGQQLHPER
jgi:acetyl esterase/lipase